MNDDTIILDDLSGTGTSTIDLSDIVNNTITIDPGTMFGATGAVGATGSSYYTITSGGASTVTLPSSTYSWSQDYNISGYTSGYGNVNITTSGIEMPSESDIKIGDKSIKAAIEKIEERLAILHPNPELEEKWENLKGLRKAYMELEAEIKEKEKMWEILKKS